MTSTTPAPNEKYEAGLQEVPITTVLSISERQDLFMGRSNLLDPDSSANPKKINAKHHEGLCQHCKEVLEWRVKFNKYKPLTQAKKCIKCLQKTVKDSYHIICRSCACKLELCAKCGKREDIVIPIQTNLQHTEQKPFQNHQRQNNRKDVFEKDDETNLSGLEDEDLDLLI